MMKIGGVQNYSLTLRRELFLEEIEHESYYRARRKRRVSTAMARS